MSPANIPTSLCPTCGYEMNAASSSEEDKQPYAGAISICLNCGQVLLFTDDLSQRLPTDEEMEDIKAAPAWTGIQSVQIAIRMRGKLHD
jgi:hypothetical protein